MKQFRKEKQEGLRKLQEIVSRTHHGHYEDGGLSCILRLNGVLRLNGDLNVPAALVTVHGKMRRTRGIFPSISWTDHVTLAAHRRLCHDVTEV